MQAPAMAATPDDLDSLTTEITTLCGHLDAAEFRLLELIRELDERAPWGLWEMKSCAHWLNWKCGGIWQCLRVPMTVPRAPTATRSPYTFPRKRYAPTVRSIRTIRRPSKVGRYWHPIPYAVWRAMRDSYH